MPLKTHVDEQPTLNLTPIATASLVRDYRWALDIDLSGEGARKHFWYISHDNLEPRHGLRGQVRRSSAYPHGVRTDHPRGRSSL